MVQDLILNILPNLTIMDQVQDEGVTQEALQEIQHTLMVHMGLHMGLHMALHMALRMALRMALHMVHLMGILAILEVPTMATGKMVLEDRIMEIMDMATEVERNSEAEGAALNRTEKKIHEEETRNGKHSERHSEPNMTC